MAGIITKVPDLLYNDRLRQTHLQQGIEMFTGADEDPYNIDITGDKNALKANIESLTDDRTDLIETEKASVITAIDAAIDVLAEGWPFADEAAFDAAIVVLKAAQAAQINANITSSLAGLQSDIEDAIDTHIDDEITVNKSDVLAAIKTDLNTAMYAYNAGSGIVFQYHHIRCKGAGQYPANEDPGADPTVTKKKHCIGCDGIGRTQTPDTGQVHYTGEAVWPLL